MKPTTVYLAATLWGLLFFTGCGFSGPGSTRLRANQDYWNAMDSAVSSVNDSRRGTVAAQLSTLTTSIDELGRWPTNNVDPELVALGQLTVRLFIDMKSYLEGRAYPAVLVGDGPTREDLRLQQINLIDEGARVHLVLAQRYGLDFPRTFDRSLELLEGPVVMTSTPYSYGYRSVYR